MRGSDIKKNHDKLPQNRLKTGVAYMESLEGKLLDENIEKNIKCLKTIFEKCSDIIFREFVFAQNEQIKLALIYTDGLADKGQVSDQIMRALALEVPMAVPGRVITKAQALEFIKERGLCIHQIKETNKVGEVVNAILSGDTVLLVDGHDTAIINGARGWEARAITDPEAEPTVRGPRESFVESLRVNTSLLRRKIKNPNLKIESFQVGRLSTTDVAIAYLEGVANPAIIKEVKTRIERIKIDAILETGYIEELIEDEPWSPFPTVNHTEKPDRVAAMLLEGRIAIFVDGTPFVLTVPSLMVEFLHASEDYYERFIFTSAVRIVRYLAAFASLVLPSLYIAIVSYHHELLPTALLLSVAAQREKVPYPAFFEVFLMELVFEVLREAGIRLPRPIGQAISIVGALVLGDSAVRAGFVAEATIIVVAFTGISSFTFHYSASISFRLLRFFLMILSGTLGIFGLTIGISAICIHLCGLRSFGVPYLSPVVPTAYSDLKDVVIRAPWWAMVANPRSIPGHNKKRESFGMKPMPPENGE
ncbi:MAG: spore germination protein [Tepidanaerobacteraceae bacterium]|jgi:spore germination protein KA|nr:spore germination protein [Tepidanaerobacteraceae bacterium]